MQVSYFQRLETAHQSDGNSAYLPWQILPMVAILFALWQAAGLFQLRPFNRWFAVAFFLWWSFTLSWNATIILRRPGVRLVPAIILFSTLIGLNLLSAWYLSRRLFREFAVQLVVEWQKETNWRHSQKVSQKMLNGEIRKGTGPTS